MASPTPLLPRDTDTVIIGNGPAALILSYILHGNIPYYDGHHPDPLLDTKLALQPNILSATPHFYEHFQSSLRYSTQALPINTFLDTLLRPNADTEANPESCVRWVHEPHLAVPHVVLGSSRVAGGQWASEDNADYSASADIGTLSYAEMLSLPGYSFGDHYSAVHGKPMPDFVRPSRREVAEYLRAYPSAVGLADAIHNGEQVGDVYRTRDGFRIGSHGIRCKHIVLGSGTFSMNIPPPAPLVPLTNLDIPSAPLLVIGSGFSAADAIISASETRRIIHIFKWAPDTRPSPLKGCHHQAYPEYAGVYKQMKLASVRAMSDPAKQRPMVRRKSKSFFGNRNWEMTYEGFPNASITHVESDASIGTATITIQCANGETRTCTVGGLEYVVGRRGTLNYLNPSLRAEVMGQQSTTSDDNTTSMVSTRSLRWKTEKSLEMAPGVFVTGSLSGDSLIRHIFGTCVHAASRIIGARCLALISGDANITSISGSKEASRRRDKRVDKMGAYGEEWKGHGRSTSSSATSVRTESSDSETGGVDHMDLHVDRRRLPLASRPGTPTRRVRT